MEQRKVIFITEKEFEQIVAAKPIFQNDVYSDTLQEREKLIQIQETYQQMSIWDF